MEGQTKTPTTRLFLALWPEPGVRHLLAEWRDAWTWPAGAAPVSDACASALSSRVERIVSPRVNTGTDASYRVRDIADLLECGASGRARRSGARVMRE